MYWARYPIVVHYVERPHALELLDALAIAIARDSNATRISPRIFIMSKHRTQIIRLAQSETVNLQKFVTRFCINLLPAP